MIHTKALRHKENRKKYENTVGSGPCGCPKLRSSMD